jgi:ATP-dependent Lon protease
MYSILYQITEESMQKQIAEVDRAFKPEVAAQHVSFYFPWTKRWKIQISAGMINVADELLTQIEGILGSPPKFTFFRIVEEQVHDEIYQRQILVFHNSRIRNTAKVKALNHAINRANTWSKSFCYRCGQSLITQDVRDEDALQIYPYLAFLNTSDHRRIFNVCMLCCERDWHQAQADAGIKPFASKSKNHDAVPNAVAAKEDEDRTEPALSAIYKMCDVDRLEQDYKDGPRDQVHRVKAIIKKIRQTSPEKRLATIPDDWRTFCDDLTQRFPNFEEVVRFFRNQLALSSIGDSVLRIPPFLLVGGPGIGKSEFMLSVACELNTRLEIINVSNAQTGSALTGSENYWSNSQPGLLFTTLIYGDIANPILMLDELDKARSDEAYKPLAALHQLLEPRQARCFTDLSVPELPFDASHVLWMATANKLDLVEKPIVDRFTVFNIDDPTREQMAIIVKNQYRQFTESHPSGRYFEAQPNDEVVEELSFYHPRKVRKVLESAFGTAAYAQRCFLTVSDIRASDRDEKEDCKNGIGFLATL